MVAVTKRAFFEKQGERASRGTLSKINGGCKLNR